MTRMTQGGEAIANRFDYATESFQRIPFGSIATSNQGRWVTALFTDSRGRIWAGTIGGTIHKYSQQLSGEDNSCQESSQCFYLKNQSHKNGSDNTNQG